MRALTIDEELKNADPSRPKWTAALYLDNRGMLFQHCSAYQTAESIRTEAVALYSQQVASRPALGEEDLGYAIANLGFVRLYAQKYDAALTNFNDAVTIARRESKRNPVGGELLLLYGLRGIVALRFDPISGQPRTERLNGRRTGVTEGRSELEEVTSILGRLWRAEPSAYANRYLEVLVVLTPLVGADGNVARYCSLLADGESASRGNDSDYGFIWAFRRHTWSEAFPKLSCAAVR